ncbi:MAG TPA: xanthine dehydrogenase family protein molybdopterin-binding subunit [Candidatus Limnocylindria bacterium]|jgi:xanthine dehydrogenase YagR molybdenum-binding subunit|nr:xanthine dehydrogenase family protein molybdopterin-binding subunit [Candidatus Limnocylindria bacterium]
MIAPGAIGAPLDRIDGPAKVTGAARYAYEHALERIAYVFPVQSTIAKGRVTAIDTRAARAIPGVLHVLTHRNAPRLASVEDAALAVLQSDAVAYHGQFVAAVVAESYEIARQAAGIVAVTYKEQPHDVVLRTDHPALYAPERVNAGFATDTASGDVEAALAAAPVTIDHTYTTPAYHNNPLEPHATVASWDDGGVTLYDANQGPHGIRDDVASAFGLEPERVRVISPYVGGGFGSKAFTHPHVILTVMAARAARRPVKLALTRRQMFALVGYRTPTIQRIRLGAERDGRMTAIAHDVVEQTSTIEEFAEQTAVATRMMYAAPNRRTTHRLARLDLPTPSIFRAPGETPGMYALESALDELAIACGIDPVELRIRNEPEVDPDTGHPFSSRNLVACLREGARRFGWEGRDPTPRARREGRWYVGTGVASSTYPARRRPSQALARVDGAGRYSVLIGASDIGTGTWTSLTQIAADALGVPVDRVRLEIGDTALPRAPIAGGSMGLASWGTAVIDAAQKLRWRLENEHGGEVPADGLEANGEAGRNPAASSYAMHGYGAQFAEVHVDVDSGEVRVPRLVGVFAVGRMINAKTGRSQLLGGMTMGISMALLEESVLDARFGHYANHDFAEYHLAVNADVGEIDVSWIAEEDPYVNPMGAKGIGEIGMVGTAAAIANAVHHATGIRVRDLPLRLDKLLT